MRTLLRVEQAVHLEDEVPQPAKSRQGLEHPTHPPPLPAVQVLGAGRHSVPVLPHVMRLLLPVRPAAGAVLAGSAAAALASAAGGMAAAEASQGVEHVGVDVLEDVEHAQLVAGVGPHVGQHRGVQIRAVGDDHPRREAVALEVVQDASHVVPVVGRDEGEGDGEVADRVGGQEQGAVAQVQFIDAQGAGEVRQGPLAVGGQVGLADLPVETVGQEPGGQVEEEVPLQGLLEAVHTHAVFEQAGDDGLADAVGVLGARVDAVDARAERRTTVAGGAVLSDRQFDEGDWANARSRTNRVWVPLR